MVNFYLPGFDYNYLEFYSHLLEIKQNNPEYFRDFRIASIYGAFAPSIWNGGRLILGYKPFASAKEIIDTLNNNDIAVRYTFTNSELEKTDVYDRYCNTIMKLSDNGKNEVIVNNKYLEKYLRKNYPNFKYILSTTAFADDYKLINKLTKKYDMVIPGYDNCWDVNFLKKLKDKDKIEILVNSECIPKCKYKVEHYKTISRAQLGEVNTCKYCDQEHKWADYKYKCEFKTYLQPEFVWNTLVPMGFSNFKIKGREYTTPEKLMTEVLKYIVLPEYVDDMLKYFLSNVTKN